MSKREEWRVMDAPNDRTPYGYRLAIYRATKDGGTGEHVANAWCHKGDESRARLIAAAPDLLEAAEKALTALRAMPGAPLGTISSLHMAIDKATPPKVQGPHRRCVVQDCANPNGDGSDLCASCHHYLTTGRGHTSQAHRNAVKAAVAEVVELLEARAGK